MQNETVIHLDNDEQAKALFGRHDEHLKAIEKEFSVTTVFKDGCLAVKGDEKSIDKASYVIKELIEVIRKGYELKTHDIKYAISISKEKEPLSLQDVYLEKIEVSSKRPVVRPKSIGQKKYIDSIRHNDIVFAIGPAGTGKTYLAMAMAVNALNKKIVSRIILTRPAIEAGEHLGFLPGNLEDKITPYLRPVYDALYDMLEPQQMQDYIEKGIIEIAPIAYMRGRTLNDSFIILDEGQNTTPEQMKMFLTRLGFDSRTVVTGDITQSDLPKGRESGLGQIREILKDIIGIEFVELSSKDVVRHELVQQIIEAYQKAGC
ncbi:MAG: PhoH family protein [Candidatus Omnitrophica bacterium]|nr:PhoH family protein [Candidatus Omnitrophota bacterium]